MSTSIVDRALGLIGLARKSKLNANFDLTSWTNENKRHWGQADALSGRSAYFKSERKTARERSRLEAANNSYYAGMMRTAANHIVGKGPRLQVQTADPELNRRIEKAWVKWSETIDLTEKLRVAIETYWRDGEWFCMRAVRPSLDPITLDVRAYEGDQVAQPYWHILDPTIEDGKRVDNLGNAVEFWIYDHHPGDLNIGHVNLLQGSWYRADEIIHLFRQERPGQLRGWPRCAPAIDWLAHMRRFSKATLSAAEAAALWGVFIKTTGSQVMPASMPQDLMTIEFERNVMNFLPDGWEPSQLRADHPATTNEAFQRTELTYFCRCANMPYSLAAGTSRDSNFSAAKMDIKNLWEPEVQSEQQKLSTVVMSTLFRWFLEDAMFVEGLLDDAPPIADIDYRFFWPPVPQSDEGDVADAATARMSSGQSSPSGEAAARGEEFEVQCQRAAADFGVTVAEVKQSLFAKLFAVAGAAPANNAIANGSPISPKSGSHASAPDEASNAGLQPLPIDGRNQQSRLKPELQRKEAVPA